MSGVLDVTFHDPLLLEYIDGKTWRVIEAFGYKPKSSPAILVPANFPTDFASIPRIFWRVIGPPVGYGSDAAYGKAAVIHDFLYANPGSRSRKDCDDIFLEAMTDLGVSPLRRRLMYAAVRCCGWKPWRSRTAERDR
jgi:hypothetical protein